MRTFESGATRDVDDTKLDLEGFLHPTVMERYAEYMHENRVQADGNLRASDNWQKGIPKDAYMKSAFRHFMDVWKEHRGIKTKDGMEKAICALMFNIMGYLFELLREKQVVTDQKEYNRRVDELLEEYERPGEPYQQKPCVIETGDYDPIHITISEAKGIPIPPESITFPVQAGEIITPEKIYEEVFKHYTEGQQVKSTDGTLHTVASVVGSEVLGFCPQRTESEVDQMAPEVCVSRCY